MTSSQKGKNWTIPTAHLQTSSILFVIIYVIFVGHFYLIALLITLNNANVINYY
jgi:hypothetical protein